MFVAFSLKNGSCTLAAFQAGLDGVAGPLPSLFKTKSLMISGLRIMRFTVKNVTNITNQNKADY